MTARISRALFLSAVALASNIAASGARADTFVETYENPGVQNSTASFSGGVSIEKFDTRTIGTGQAFSTNFGSGFTELTYSGVEIRGADLFGGAGGAGRYAVIFTNGSYTVSLSKPVTYFGYWLSALDAGNQVEFYSGATQVGTLTPASVLSAIGGNSAYFGNPNPAFLGQDAAQPFAFVNFFDTTGSFDRVVFSETLAAAGYESDNHTVGTFSDISGNPVPVVPEPSTLLLMSLGLVAVAGFSARRARRAQRSIAHAGV